MQRPHPAKRLEPLLQQFVTGHRGAPHVRKEELFAVDLLLTSEFTQLARNILRKWGPSLAEAAEDAGQGWYQAMRTQGVFQYDSQLFCYPYAYRILQSQCAKLARKSSSCGNLASLEELTDPGADPSLVVERREKIERLNGAMNALSLRDRNLLMLVYEEGLTHPEVGQILGLTPSAVSTRLSRIRKWLRRRMHY
jgi:RNA polymerase sigma-70 factor (ECF subfamily)